MDEAIDIAKQIADALSAAHEQGVVHRDLKPANIKLTKDGTVKVLDFGLAKEIQADSGLPAGQSLSPTITSPALMTSRGMILGTAAYMSPEQARGKPIDKRTDIWAFGCVLFEMLTGRRAFDGETTSDVIAAIIERAPDWKRLPGKTPPHVVRIIERCLEKAPKRICRTRAARPKSMSCRCAIVNVSRYPPPAEPIRSGGLMVRSSSSRAGSAN